MGKIVVYNQECQDYPTCVQYRNDGASKAAEHGAVASLTRSIASFSIYNPHTGPVVRNDNAFGVSLFKKFVYVIKMYRGSKKIPAAAITIEDAAFIERIMKRGWFDGVILKKLILSNVNSKQFRCRSERHHRSSHQHCDR